MGRRPVILVAMTLYALASLGAMLTTDFTLFLAYAGWSRRWCLRAAWWDLATLRDMYRDTRGSGQDGHGGGGDGHRADDRTGGRRCPRHR
jgi:hypothetical protein